MISAIWPHDDFLALVAEQADVSGARLALGFDGGAHDVHHLHLNLLGLSIGQTGEKHMADERCYSGIKIVHGRIPSLPAPECARGWARRGKLEKTVRPSRPSTCARRRFPWGL